jgi:hypothetical protein
MKEGDVGEWRKREGMRRKESRERKIRLEGK